MAKNLEQIEVGDRVWVRSGTYGRKLRRVERLTPRQIVLDGHPDYARFHRGTLPRRGSNPSYNQIGYTGTTWTRIEAVATPEECEAWDAEQKRLADERAAQERGRQAREAKRRELTDLFGSERAWVSESRHNLAGE